MARKTARNRRAAAPAHPSAPRVQVTGIVVYLAYPDGTTRVVTYDPRRVEALFWSQRAVTEMLGRYYTDKDVVMTREHCVECFGHHRTRRVMGQRKAVRITPELLEALWNAPDEHGCCIGLLAKEVNTQPGG